MEVNIGVSINPCTPYFENSHIPPYYNCSAAADINECEDEGVCGEYEVCVDTPGGYYCECQDGYYFNQDTERCDSESLTLEHEYLITSFMILLWSLIFFSTQCFARSSSGIPC